MSVYSANWGCAIRTKQRASPINGTQLPITAEHAPYAEDHILNPRVLCGEHCPVAKKDPLQD